MKSLNDSIVINADISKIYNVATKIKDFPGFLKGYKKVTVLDSDGNKNSFIRVTFEVNGQEVVFHCLARFEKNKTTKYEHVTGPLKGMEVRWEFRRRYKNTKVNIKHNFPKTRPPIFGGIDPMPEENLSSLLNKSAQGILSNLKRRCEQ
jgi:ribosome-associated toxin RatA of RatAB toxin-antitoxin module